MSAAISPISTDGACVCPRTVLGITEASATRRFIAGLGRGDGQEDCGRSGRTVVRSHEKLCIDYRETGDRIALGTETPRGWVEELSISRAALEAVAFCVRTSRFDVLELPGRLTDDERWGIAEALEQTGLFAIEDSDR